jgi:hypothetical protein
MKLRALKFIRNTLVSVVVIAVVFVGAGVGYTWYEGRHTPKPALTDTTPVPKLSVAPEHTEPGSNVPESASVETITSPVTPDSNASLTVQTLGGSSCTITVLYNKIPSTDSGLKQKIADTYGVISWSWTVGPDTPPGSWPVTVTCTHNQKNAVVQSTLSVVASLPTNN